MGFTINTNISALNAHRNVQQINTTLNKSLNSLSSGLRINKAADDASGMTIANSLRAQFTGLGQAIRNANDGIGVAQTADGALDEYENIINIVRTKAIQAASDGQNDDSRMAIQRDVSKLLEEADNIANTTSFNGLNLLDGSFTNKNFQIGAYFGETVSLSIGSASINQIAKRVSSEVTGGGTGATIDGSSTVDGTSTVQGGSTVINGSAVEDDSTVDEGSTIDHSYVSDRSTVKGASTVTNESYVDNDSIVDGGSTIETSYIRNGSTVKGASSVNDSSVHDSTVDEGSTIEASQVNDGSTVKGASSVNDSYVEEDSTVDEGSTIDESSVEESTVKGASIVTNNSYIEEGSTVTSSNISRSTVSGASVTGTNLINVSVDTGTVIVNGVVQSGSISIGSGGSISASGITYTAPNTATTTTEDTDKDSLSAIDVTTRLSAEIAIETTDRALKDIDAIRSGIGSTQNQLEATIRNISTTQINVKAAESQLRDVDFAKESANFVKLNILTQSGSYVLSQAYAKPQSVLRILESSA